MAMSGEAGGPSPEQTAAMLDALSARRGHAAAGAMLTSEGVLGRDPGAAAGRADGTPGARALRLSPGETGVFDGRFEIVAGADAVLIRAAGADGEAWDRRAPAPLRPGGACVAPDSRRDSAASCLDIDARVRFLGPERCAHLLLRKADRACLDADGCGDATPRTGEAGVNAHIVG
jgi:hypothetical protein